MRWAQAAADPVFREFWTRRMYSLLSTVRPDGRPHVVAVNPLVDLDSGLVEVLSSGSSVKVANLRAGQTQVSVSRLDGGHWSSLEGVAHVRAEPEVVADAERRYAERFRPPRPNPNRVIISIQVQSVLGRW